MVIKPAYGRNYPTKEACLLDWNAGKDFKILNGPYCSIRDIEYMKVDFQTIDIHWFHDPSRQYRIINIWRNPIEKLINTTIVDMA